MASVVVVNSDLHFSSRFDLTWGLQRNTGPSAKPTVFAQDTLPPKMCPGIISTRHSPISTPQGAQLPMDYERTRQEL